MSCNKKLSSLWCWLHTTHHLFIPILFVLLLFSIHTMLLKVIKAAKSNDRIVLIQKLVWKYMYMHICYKRWWQ